MEEAAIAADELLKSGIELGIIDVQVVNFIHSEESGATVTTFSVELLELNGGDWGPEERVKTVDKYPLHHKREKDKSIIHSVEHF